MASSLFDIVRRLDTAVVVSELCGPWVVFKGNQVARGQSVWYFLPPREDLSQSWTCALVSPC